MTGCYGPLLLGTCDRMGAVTPRIELNGRPAGILSLVSDDTVLFYNGSADAIACRWRPAGGGQWQDLRLAAGTETTASSPERATAARAGASCLGKQAGCSVTLVRKYGNMAI